MPIIHHRLLHKGADPAFFKEASQSRIKEGEGFQLYVHIEMHRSSFQSNERV